MEKYTSKQGRILRPAEQIYTALSSFDNFTPILKDKVDEWQATADHCSFKVKGFSMGLDIVEREPFSTIKIAAAEGAPMDFAFWLQLKQVEDNDTRIRMVLHIELNMVMKMMIGGKIQGMLDQMIDNITASFGC